MKAFTVLKGVAAPLPVPNIDTDKIIPKQYLKTIQRTGLGQYLFDEIRFTPDRKERPDFVLNKPAYRQASILVAGENFGCGSSREHAPWALLDFGIHCVIAPSYADIFYNNCFKNGILPVIMPKDKVDILMKDAEAGKPLTVDLPRQKVLRDNGEAFSFEIDGFRKHCLVNGLDDIGLTLEHEPDITAFEKQQKGSQSWLYK
ncbi:MAG: 3-isopropylmalate dehydratase small subunit [Alphaproteobacteria bacterium]|nr:3-isopropylmalate dehydratase small subunit [Alphaproteobacteria bacterium]